MWKNWNPFRRRTEETANRSVTQNEALDGKENTVDLNTRGLVQADSGTSNQTNGDVNSQFSEHRISNRNINSSNYNFRKANGHGNVENNSLVQSSFDEDDSLCLLPGGSASRRSPIRGAEIGVHGHQNVLSSLRRSVTTSPITKNERNMPRNSSMKSADESLNNSFSGVYGPLLSSPIVPKVRRALESSAGLRSPQTSLIERGRPLGRSSSLNYGSGSPTTSMAGQVPWVRLKMRESIALSDLVSGNTPQSPNTVKLAAPETRFLPAAPSFKTTPVIVTTEPNRAHVVDTQTVVSALREKRKRFGGGQRNDFLSDDSWINAAKRRRQDSSQSNASSVSIPSMPESLPNLMGTPGVSLLHIENLKDQRPSTVPAMDAFVSRHQRDFGLGGVTGEHKLQQPVYSNQQPHHHPEKDVRNKQNGKTVLRSIQSSLSSSLRARTNLSVLEQAGVDLNRIYRESESCDGGRKTSTSSEVSTLNNSIEEPRSKISRQTTEIISTPTAALDVTDKVEPMKQVDNNAGLVSTHTKQKIADGVVLRKHSLSVTSNNSPARSKQVLPLNTLVSASDFEQDRQKEYKRRVLDLLEEEEEVVGRPAASTTMGLEQTSSAPTLGTFSSLPVSTEASSAATSAAVSASLDSLNKLVQSAVSPSSGSVTSVNTLTQLLMSSNGQKPASSDSTPSAPYKEVTIGNTSSPPSSASEPPSTTTISSTPGAFKFDVSLPSTSGGGLSMTTSGTNFQINFSSSVAPTTSAVSSGSSQQTSGSGFNFTAGSVSSSLQNPAVVGSTAAGSIFTGVGQTVPPAPGFGNVEVKQLGSTAHQSDNNSLAFKVLSVPPTTVADTTSQGASGMFSSGGLQGTRSGSFSLSTTLQAFAAQKSGTEGSLTGQAMSSTGGQGFNFTPSSSGTATATPSATGLLNFGASSSAAAAPSGFGFGSLGGTTTTPSSSFTTTTVSSAPSLGINFAPGMSAAPSLGNSTSSNLAFNFGPTSSSTATSTQPLGGLSFGVASNNPMSLSSSGSLTTSIGSSGFSTQSGNSIFTGFGTNSQTPSNTSTVASTTTSAQIGSGASAFGTSSMPAQQPFGSANPASTFSLFTTTSSATPNTGSGMFPFGQNAYNAALSKPGTFGVMSTQPGAMFGAAQGTVTTSSSVFGNTGAASSGVPSIFGGGNTPAFGNSSSVPTTSQPAFGNNPVSAPFGSSAPMTAPPAFGFTATSSVFGASNSQTSSLFGASNTQTSSVLGAASSSGGQPSSVFGAPASSTNLFTFGAGSGSQPTTQQTTSFGSNMGTTFGNTSGTAGFSMFGAKPAVTGFTAAPGNPASMFGTPTQTSSTTPSPAFGSSLGQSATFGAPTNQEKSSFGPAAGFGTSGLSTYGNASQVSVFGSATQNTSQNTFGSTAQNPPQNAFGSAAQNAFGSATQNPSQNLFGAATQNSQNTFGSAAQNPPQNLFGTATQNSQNAFGSASSNNTPVFGSQQSSLLNSNLFNASSGGSSFGGAKPSFFGATNTSQTGLGFGTAQPGTFNSQTPATGFNFGQTTPQPPASASTGFNFSAQTPVKPTFQSPTPGGFNFASAAGASTPTFNFSGTPNTPNMFNPQTPGTVPRPRVAAARRQARRGGTRR